MSLNYENQPDWAKLVIDHELSRSQTLLSKGIPVEEVLEETARRISHKLMHPVFKSIKDNAVIEYDLEEVKRTYFKNHPTGRVADHMNDVD